MLMACSFGFDYCWLFCLAVKHQFSIMKYFATFLLMSFSLACFAKGEITIKGKLSSYSDSVICFSYKMSGDEGKFVFKKTAVASNGSFSFTVDGVSEPTVVRISEPDFLKRLTVKTPKGLTFVPTRTIELVVAPSRTYTVSASLTNPYAALVTGDELNAAYSTVRTNLSPLNAAAEKADFLALSAQYATPFDSLRFAAATKTSDSLKHALQIQKEQWIYSHPKSMVSAVLLAELSPFIDVDILERLYNHLAKNVRSSNFLKGIDVKIRSMRAIVIGGKPFSFKGTQPNGSLFSSTSLKGRWYILEFWGSWCRPCRSSHPELLEVYNKYHSKGLEIVSVASDANDAVWTKAIAADGIGVWKHVRSQKTNDIVGLFDINAFPTKLFINPDGVITSIKVGYDSGELLKEAEKIYGK